MPAFLHCPGVQRAHQYPCDHQPLGDATASNRGVGAVIEILQSGNEMLREAGYSAEPVRIGSRDALVFESDTVLGFVCVYDSSAELMESRSEERSVGKECVSPCSSRWEPYIKTKK